jgi:hypothetical protein
MDCTDAEEVGLFVVEAYYLVQKEAWLCADQFQHEETFFRRNLRLRSLLFILGGVLDDFAGEIVDVIPASEGLI